MTVIHITSPAQIGGTITSTIRQAALQKRQGKEVEVWSSVQRQGDHVQSLSEKYDVPCKQQSRLAIGVRVLLLSFRRGNKQSGVIHIHTGRSDASPFVNFLARMASKRFSVVLTLHGPSFLDDWSNADRKRTHLENLRRIRAIGVPSLFERERQIEFGVESDRVFAVPDPLTCYSAERGALRKSICIPDRDCVVIYCGRLTPQKGVNTLIETAELMLPSRRDVHFVIAGDGPLLEKCRQTASRFPSQFHVLGHIDDVGAVYADGDIYVSPSSCESFGISAMEAGLSGKPMLLSRIRPWTDVLTEGTDCYFFTDGKTSDFAQKLERLIESPQDRNRLADNARLSIMSQFSDLAICDALEKMYNCRRNSAI